MCSWNWRACVQQFSLPTNQSLVRGSYLLGRLCSSLWNWRTFFTCHYSSLPWPHLLTNLDRRPPWWSWLLTASLFLQLQLYCAPVRIFSTPAIQVCIKGWCWDDAVWSSYQSRAYLHVSMRKHLGFPLRRRSFSLSLKLGVLFWSSIPSSNLLGWSQLLMVFLTVREWVLVHWSPLCGSLPMLG